MEELISKISVAEFEVMRVLWDKNAALSLSEICLELQSKNNWNKSTSKTLLSRLVKKGAIKQEKNRIYHYAPIVTEADFKTFSTQTLVDKFFQGNVKNLLVSLVSSSDLNKEDIEELRSLLREESDNE